MIVYKALLVNMTELLVAVSNVELKICPVVSMTALGHTQKDRHNLHIKLSSSFFIKKKTSNNTYIRKDNTFYIAFVFLKPNCAISYSLR
jgi:hypothetical protein